MVIISENLVVNAGPSFDANSPLVGYANQATIHSIATTTADADYPYTNMANPATHLKWKGTAAGAFEYITVTGAADIDYLAIAGHNFGSTDISLLLETSNDAGATWTSVAAMTPTTDEPILFWFDKAAYSRVRLRLNVSFVVPELAVLFVGETLQLERNIYVGHTPITLGRDFKSVTGISESGNFLGRIVVGSGRSTEVSLQNLTPDWYREYLDPFIVAAQEQPFFFAWRPGTYPLEVGYCWLTNSPRPSNQRSNGMMQVDLQMAGIA